MRDSDVVRSGRVGDIELGDGDLAARGRKRADRIRDAGGAASLCILSANPP